MALIFSCLTSTLSSQHVKKKLIDCCHLVSYAFGFLSHFYMQGLNLIFQVVLEFTKTYGSNITNFLPSLTMLETLISRNTVREEVAKPGGRVKWGISLKFLHNHKWTQSNFLPPLPILLTLIKLQAGGAVNWTISCA